MLKILLIILIIFLLFFISIGLFIRKLAKIFGFRRANTFHENQSEDEQEKIYSTPKQEVLYTKGDVTVLRGDAKNGEQSE